MDLRGDYADGRDIEHLIECGYDKQFRARSAFRHANGGDGLRPDFALQVLRAHQLQVHGSGRALDGGTRPIADLRSGQSVA